MARTSKNAITIDDLLQESNYLSTVAPYQIPDNWCWVNLLNAFDNATDSKRKIQQKNYLEEGGFAIVDQGQELIGGYTNDENMLFSGQLPIIVFGDHTRCIKYIDFPFAQGADGVKVLIPKPFFKAKALYYAFKSVEIPDMGYRRHFPILKNHCIPVPPLAEQQRIVERIESLFAKLDEAKEKAQAVIDSYEDRKSAILHKAFTGELTEKWRVENRVSDEWKTVPFKEFCYLNRGFDLPIQNRVKGKVPLVASNGIIDYVDRANVIGPGVVTGRSGTIGKVFYIKEDYWPLNTALYSKDCCGNNAKYIYYYLSSFNFKQYSSSTAVPTLNRNNFFNVEVKVPSIKEQEEIVRILDSIFEKEDKSKELLDMLDKIDEMKKSILARAFRGELGTNDPTDEPATDLLRKILEQSN